MSLVVAVEADVEERMAPVVGRLNVQHAELVELAAEAVGSGEWSGCGIHTAAQWLTIQAGVSPHRAKQIVRVAERIDQYPTLRATFGRGELSFEQVYEVATKAPAWADGRVTEFATLATVPQLRRVLRDEFFDGDPDEPEPPARDDRERCSFGWDDDSRFHLSAAGDADGGATVEAALNEARDALFHGGDETVTWWDALVAVCGRSLSTASPERRERFKTYLHVDVETGRSQLTNGVVLPSRVRDYLLCDTQVQPVWERDNTPFGVGRSMRVIPDRTRRIVEFRDQGCVVPGCNARHVEIHHIIHWTAGGPTETWNLVSLCRKHHKLHHRGLLGIAGNADQTDGLVFSDRHGRPLGNHATPAVPVAPAPEPELGYRHPTGERLQMRWFFGWTHPNAKQRQWEQAQTASKMFIDGGNAIHEWRQQEALEFYNPHRKRRPTTP